MIPPIEFDEHLELHILVLRKYNIFYQLIFLIFYSSIIKVSLPPILIGLQVRGMKYNRKEEGENIEAPRSVN